jgi:phosphatidylserine/phosphatidylglycerophosphate/cardiolipin synthase-like enzyme
MNKHHWYKNKKPKTPFLLKNTKSEGFQHIHTSKSCHKIYNEICNGLAMAENSIFIINFLITNEEIISKIIDKRNMEYIRTRIITWLNQKDHLLIDEDNIYDLFKSQAQSWRRLGINNIPIRSNIKCHIKCILIDKKIAFITSANLTDTSLKMNPENGVMFYGLKEEIEIIYNFMKTLWNNYTDYEIMYHCSKSLDATDDGYLSEYSRTTSFDPEPIMKYPQETNNVRFLYALPKYNTLYTFVKSILKRARKEILLLSYKFKPMKKTGILSILKDKIDEGVKVKILVCHKDTQILEYYSKIHDLGCEVLSINRSHGKAILIDQTEVLTMTSNVDEYFFPDKDGINIGIYLKNKILAKQAKSYINNLFENYDYRLNGVRDKNNR